MLRHAEPIELRFYPATPDDIPSTGVDCAHNPGATPADLGYWQIPFKCEVFEANVGIIAGLAGTGVAARFKFDRRFTTGSDSGRTDGDVGDIYLGITGASAAGDVVYDLAGQAAGVTLEPGMQVVFEAHNTCSGTGKAGKVWPTLLVKQIPEVRANLSKLQETT